MTKVFALIVVLLAIHALLPLGILTAQAPPAIPHAFFGAVTLDGQPAPVGAQVEARGEGVNTRPGAIARKAFAAAAAAIDEARSRLAALPQPVMPSFHSDPTYGIHAVHRAAVAESLITIC